MSRVQTHYYSFVFRCRLYFALGRTVLAVRQKLYVHQRFSDVFRRIKREHWEDKG